MSTGVHVAGIALSARTRRLTSDVIGDRGWSCRARDLDSLGVGVLGLGELHDLVGERAGARVCVTQAFREIE
jgi:hypothetical protein